MPAVHGHHVLDDHIHSRSERVPSRDRTEANWRAQSQRSQRHHDDQLAADEQHKDAERQRGHPDAGRVEADADGDDDGEHDEAEDEVVGEVVEGPGAGAAEGPAGGGGADEVGQSR